MNRDGGKKIFLQIRLGDAHAQPSERGALLVESARHLRCMWEPATSEIVAWDPHSIDIDANIDANKSIFGSTGSPVCGARTRGLQFRLRRYTPMDV